MNRPSALVFNELNGQECKDILRQRFEQLLNDVPFLQRHLTLPRVRMSLLVTLDLYADQPTPETCEISDTVTLSSEVCSAPTPGGRPPDQVRDEHNLPVPTPGRGPRDIGGHVVTADYLGDPPPRYAEHAAVLENRVVQDTAGLEIDRTGTGGITSAGIAKMQNATVANMDQGPAGLRSGGERGRLGIFKNQSRS